MVHNFLCLSHHFLGSDSLVVLFLGLYTTSFFPKTEGIRSLVRDSLRKHLLIVFVILDAHGPRDSASLKAPSHPTPSSSSSSSHSSILDLKTVSFDGAKMVMESYMDSFPFPFYIIEHDMHRLPDTLADALCQFFELVNSSTLD